MALYNHKARALTLGAVILGGAFVYLSGATTGLVTAYALAATAGFTVLARNGLRRFPNDARILTLELAGVMAFPTLLVAQLWHWKSAATAAPALLGIHIALWAWMFGGALRANDHRRLSVALITSATLLALTLATLAGLTAKYEWRRAWSLELARNFLWNRQLLIQFIFAFAPLFCATALIGANYLPEAPLAGQQGPEETRPPNGPGLASRLAREMFLCAGCLAGAAVPPIMLTLIPFVLSIFTVWFIGHAFRLMVDVLKEMFLCWLVVFAPLFLLLSARLWARRPLLISLLGIGVSCGGAQFHIAQYGAAKQVWLIIMLFIFACVEFTLGSMAKSKVFNLLPPSAPVIPLRNDKAAADDTPSRQASAE